MSAWTKRGIKCFAFGWVPGWAVAVFLSSALIAQAELSPLARGCGLACTLAVADEMSPQAKLTFGLVLGALMVLARRKRPERLAVLAILDAAAATAAMMLILALLPLEWSRGFGTELFGVHFAVAPTAIYICSAAIAGAIGTVLERSCRQRLDGATHES